MYLAHTYQHVPRAVTPHSPVHTCRPSPAFRYCTCPSIHITHTSMYTHVPALVTQANIHARTHNCKLISHQHIRDHPVQTLSLPPLISLFMWSSIAAATPVHLLALSRVLRLRIRSTIWFLHAFIHILTQQALIEHLLYARHCCWLWGLALLLASCWWGRRGRDRERLRES